MPRIAVAGFVHETNTFSPLPTAYEDFALPGEARPGLVCGAELLAFFQGRRLNDAMCGFLAAAGQAGYQIIPLCYCAAAPSGTVSSDAFERLLHRIVAELDDARPLDGVFLALHGAMVYEGFHPGEPEILERIRAVLGDIPVVASLDLHANISADTVLRASALVGYRTYPHVDEFETGWRCAALMARLLAGAHLYKAYRRLPFLIPLSTQSTHTEPARSIYASLGDVEANPDILSASILMGFPPADVPDAGPSVLAYGLTRAAADDAAARLYQALLAREAEFAPNLLTADQGVERAIELAMTAAKPVILADVQDNPGAGATSDTPWILQSLVAHKAEGAALGIMYDPAAADAAHAAGRAADLELGLGGKLTPGQTPFYGAFHVEQLADGDFDATGPMMGGRRVNLGKMAQLRIGGTRIVVSSVRVQAIDRSYFRQVGIEPGDIKILALKSTNHYRADFEPIASHILSISAPGAMVEDLSGVPYRNLRDGVRLGPLGPEHRRAGRSPA